MKKKNKRILLLIPMVFFVIAILGVTIFLVTREESQETRSEAGEQKEETILTRFGVQHLTGNLTDWSNTNRLGISWVRSNPEGIGTYSKIVQERGIYDWSKSNNLTIKYSSLYNKDFNIIGTFNIASDNYAYPKWASSNECGPLDKIPLSEFAEFAGLLAERWDGELKDGNGGVKINYWEVLNEPDTLIQTNKFVPNCWGSYPELYAELLKEVSSQVKEANPEAQILFGGSAICKEGESHCISEGENIFEYGFVEKVFQIDGIEEYFDYMNFHYYEGNEFDYWYDYGMGIIGKTKYVQQLMQDNNFTKPIIITETNVCEGETINGIIYDKNDISDYIHKLSARILSIPQIEASLWWTLEDIENYANCGFYDAQGMNQNPNSDALQSLKNYYTPDSKTVALYNFNNENIQIEGYEIDTNKQIWWVNGDSLETTNIVAKKIETLTARGKTQTISDGRSGDLDHKENGQIKISLNNIPTYITITEESLRLEATVGFQYGAFNTDGIHIDLRTYENNEWIDIIPWFHKGYSRQLTKFIANLDPYFKENEERELVIGIDNFNANTGEDWVIWTEAIVKKDDWSYDLIENADEANWHTRTGFCSFIEQNCELTAGSVKYLYDVMAEDFNTYERVLFTHPDWVDYDKGFMHAGYTIKPQ